MEIYSKAEPDESMTDEESKDMQPSHGLLAIRLVNLGE